MPNSGAYQVRTVEVIAALALILFCGNFALGIITREVASGKVVQAEMSLQSLANQMAAIEPLANQSVAKRSIASIGIKSDLLPAVLPKTLRSAGTIGRDPWGNSFAYKYLRDPGDRLAYLVLVSGGKNSQIETDLTDLNFGRVKSGAYKFKSDDIGHIKRIDAYNK